VVAGLLARQLGALLLAARVPALDPVPEWQRESPAQVRELE
jgi:hypothetical protein